MLKRLAIGFVFVLIFAGAALAGTVKDGWDAYRTGDYAAALQLWEPLADQGDADAQVALSMLYLLGKGVPQDNNTSVLWLTKAAEQGHIGAQISLGLAYEKGSGVAKSDSSAVTWFRRAAQQGNAVAQYYLGSKYAHGEGVPQDFLLAYFWLNIAASHLDDLRRVFASGMRDELAAKMPPSQIAQAQRMAREWEPKPER